MAARAKILLLAMVTYLAYAQESEEAKETLLEVEAEDVSNRISVDELQI
jgi:hypothetical protein